MKKINNNSNSNTTIVGNVSRFNVYFPQLSKSTFLNPQRNVSSKPGLTTMLKNASSEAIKLKSCNVINENKSDQYELTDIDYFFNDKYFDDLDFIGSNDIKNDLQHYSFVRSELLCTKYGDNVSNIPSNLSSTTKQSTLLMDRLMVNHC